MVRQLQQKGMLPNPMVHKMKMFTFYIKIHNNQYDIHIIYAISFIKYRIQLKVEDSSGMAAFILFDVEAEN